MSLGLAMRRTGLWWWIDRWRKSSAFMDMTLEEQGAYRNLLDEAALRGGPLPNDERILAKACGDAVAWKRLRKVLLPRFEKSPEGLRNTTLDEVLRESQLRSDKQRAYRNSQKNGHGNGPANGGSSGDGDGEVTDGVTKATSGSGSGSGSTDRSR